MDVSALLLPLVSQVTQQLLPNQQTPPAATAETQTFSQVMSQQAQKLRQATPVQEWAEVRETLAGMKDYEPSELNVRPDGSLFVLAEDGSEHAVPLPPEATQLLKERHASADETVALSLEAKALSTGLQNEIPLRLVSQLNASGMH